MQAIVIVDGALQRTDLEPSLHALQEIVDGYIEPVFTLPSKDGSITAYVNEEGLLLGKPFTFGLALDIDYVIPVAGNAVIVGVTEEGDTRGLTDEECVAVASLYRPGNATCAVKEGTQVPIALVPVAGMLDMISWNV